MRSLFPIQSPPVARPEIIFPWETVNVTHGTIDQLLSVFMHLTHGANYDDPSPWMGASFDARRNAR